VDRLVELTMVRGIVDAAFSADGAIAALLLLVIAGIAAIFTRGN
jgi:hypothetical protein